MKKLILLSAILFCAFSLFSQTLTVRQAFNFSVGDTFEHTYSLADFPNDQGCLSGLIINVITSKVTNGDTITYGYNSFTTNTSGCLYGLSNSGQSGPLPGGAGCALAGGFQTSASGNGSFQVYNLDSSVFSPSASSFFSSGNPCDTPYCTITNSNSLQFNGRKQSYIKLYELSTVKEIYVDSLGLVSRNDFWEGQPSVSEQDSLIYYHKANGAGGGQFMQPVISNSISGNVSKHGAVCAMVYLIRQDTVGHLLAVDSVVTNCALGGVFAFNNMPADTYYVKTALETIDSNYAAYLPTYFDSPTSHYYRNVLQWDSAAPIVIPANGTTSFSVTMIGLIPGINPGGPGFVGGWVSQGANIVNTGQGNSGRSAGQALEHIQINLISSTGSAVAYTYTDVAGHYNFNNLAYGSYKLYAEVLGKTAYPIYFTLSAQSPYDTSLDISVNSNLTTGIENAESKVNASIFPNPAAGYFVLYTPGRPDIKMDLKVFDLTGREIKSVNINYDVTEIDRAAIASGVYYWKLESSSGILNRGKLVLK